ncbi:MAG: LPS export ABC transporter periplasmic protein LptC [Rikenellaceae bacterium]
MVALLFWGSAISLFSCASEQAPRRADNYESLLTEQSNNLEIVMSKNGKPSYRFRAPLVEGYNMAKEPYREFRRGVEIITYKDDSLSQQDAILTARYAIYYTERELWEAKGDVEVVNAEGKHLYSQQLFWNAKTEKIYSNVDTKIVDSVTGDTYIGEGFEADESMEQWSYRKMRGRMEMDLSPTKEPSDTTAIAPVIEIEE